MKVTNRYNLPQPFVDFEEAHQYHHGDADYSITTLLSPPQIVALEKLHDDVLEEDVSDAILRLLGTATHNVLETSAKMTTDDSARNEERMYGEINGVRISGQIDRLEKVDITRTWDMVPCEIQDYKVTSADTLIHNPGGKKEWEWQVNGYAWLARENGFNVQRGEIAAIIRDWKKAKSRYVNGYPDHSVKRIRMELWEHDEVGKFLAERIAMHEEEVPPLCTDEDRWIGKSKWAVYKHVAGGALGKRAARVLDTEFEAESYVIENSILGEIVERPGTAVRCEDWCAVSKFCNQYKESLK